MNIDFLTGLWTYRSFLNNPDEVSDFNTLRFGQGEMVFEKSPETGKLRGQLAFRSSPPEAEDPRLTLRGSVQYGNPFSVRFQGVGVEKTAAEGWVYDYVGYYVPDWPHGQEQRSALVGSVIRSVPHDDGQGGTRPAGVVASFIAVKRDFLEPRVILPLPDTVRAMLASRGHRLHHMIWHGVRSGWLNLSEQDQQHITALGWAPPRPSFLRGAPLVTNGSGEDFLYMHRRMIAMVNKGMWEAGKSQIKPWGTIPPPGPLVIEPDFEQKEPQLLPPGNPDGFAIPPTWAHPTDEMSNRRIAALKTDEYYWSTMKWWDRGFKNAAYLATLSLGEMGALLEYSVHNDMHMRWSSMPHDPDLDPQKHGKPLPEGRADNDLRTKWDRPDYDFLGEFYSSHVNPVFWRLHGWVDDRIEDWYRAHEQAHPGQVERREHGGVQWFKPGKWVIAEDPWEGPRQPHSHECCGGDSHHHEKECGGGHHDHNGYDVSTMEKVAAVLFGDLILDKPAPKVPVTLVKAPPDAAMLERIPAAPQPIEPPVGPRRTWFSSL